MDTIMPVTMVAQVRGAWAEPAEEAEANAGPTESEAAPTRYPDADDTFPAKMFADAEEMKRKVRRALVRKTYNVADFYKTEGIFQRIAKNTMFEHTTLAIISFNALWMWIDADYNTAASLVDAEIQFQLAEHFFCIYFSFEWFVRFSAFRRKRDCLKDAWFLFDSALVFLMVLETWAMTAVVVISSGDAGGMLNASILRLFRLLRLSRLARMLRSMPELMILIKGMISATRSVIITLLLLFILLYIFAIALKQLTENTPVIAADTGINYFGTIPRSMYHLLLSGVFLDNLGPVMGDIGDASPVFAILFLIFIALAALMVMNMLIGVLCEVVSAVAATEREEMLVTFVRDRMEHIIKEIDKNNNGHISQNEFKMLIGNELAIRSLNEVGVDPEGLVDFVDFIFDPDSEEGKVGETQITFEKFMNVILDFRGSNTATVKHIMSLTKLIKTEFKTLVERMRLPQRRTGPRAKTVAPTSTADKCGSGGSPCSAMRGSRGGDAAAAPDTPRSFASHHQRTVSEPPHAKTFGSDISTVEGMDEALLRAHPNRAVLLQTARAEAFLLAAQGELQRLRTGPCAGAAATGAPADQTRLRLQAWADKLGRTMASALDDLHHLQCAPEGQEPALA